MSASGYESTVPRWLLASVALALPVVLALAFYKATTEPGDANIGGALFLFLSPVVGVFLAVAVWRGRPG